LVFTLDGGKSNPGKTAELLNNKGEYRMAKRQARGIDIDENARTGGTNFTLAKKLVQDGVYDFLIIKAGLGIRKSEIFDEQRQAAEQAGIPYVTYHLPDPSADMIKQARDYIKWVGKDQPAYIVDIERPYDEKKGGRLPKKNELKAYLAEFEKLTSKPPLLYTRMDILKDTDFLKEAEEYSLWLAEYPYKNAAKEELYKDFDDFLGAHAWTAPSTKGSNLEKNVILWQFSKKGRPDLIYNKKTKHHEYKVGKQSADLNISIKERDEFMKQLFGKVPPKPGSVDQSLTETLAQMEKMKEAGITPEVQIQINTANLDVKTLETLKGKLEKAGASPEVHINIQAGADAPVDKQVPTDDEAEQPGPEPKPNNRFTVEVKAKTGQRTAVQSIVDRKENGVPVMGPHEPRIALPNGTRLRVSSTHKESGKDKGDGVIYGGKQLYYKITEAADNKAAAGLFVKKQDVKKV